MSTADHAVAKPPTFAPPYPAALTIPHALWRSTLARGGRIPLAKPVVQIGRMEGNDVLLGDPLVSRHHAVIRWSASGYELEDLGAANGTFVQGQRIAARVPLVPGQVIRIGNVELVFDVFAPDRQLPSLDALRAIPLASAPAPSPSPHDTTASSPHPYYDALEQPAENGVIRLVKNEWRKRYWRIFLLGLIAYIVVAQVLRGTTNLHLVPLEMLLASALVPVVFVIFCWEQNAFADIPPAVVGITFMSGAILGLSIAALVEPLFIPVSSVGTGVTLTGAIAIALCEETAKVVSVAWFLRDRRLRGELDGLILGAAAGMGFAALETAGYGFVAFLVGFDQTASLPNASLSLAISTGVAQMNHQLLLRMALAIFGHGVWTAIVCAAIWRERGQSTFRLTPSVLAAFGIAVALHALWDWAPLFALLPGSTDSRLTLAVVVGWFVLVGGLGLAVLRFFLHESLERAKLGPSVLPPKPLLSAILDYLFQPSSTPALLPQPGFAPAPVTALVPAAPDGAERARTRAPMPEVPPPAPRSSSAPPASPRPPSPSPSLNAGRSGMPQSPRDSVYCPRCAVSYPAALASCMQCGGPLAPLP